ncbi:DIE2/ALG10 family-domain-containing protein [Cercophora scortea]|uniref:Dol-P-Glc:Glc(2)Man(9)GlcNAc(2)-PP-Dol alpha-1,2-glucosyltransferase n=1 Tax=Cercophora scortea TaxID=314031 RepID=A0AAE0IGI9_9PEZI|nr:DIE2/ALG10 family-domain-containing protein [Cercophora scortea]
MNLTFKSSLLALQHGWTSDELLRALVVVIGLAFFISPPSQSARKNKSASISRWGTPWAIWAVKTGILFSVYLLGKSWLVMVQHHQTQPYLDEVFHIPQAQKYCQGRYQDWDDKITTPPGLYLISMTMLKLRNSAACAAADLRAHNLLGVMLLILVGSFTRGMVEARHGKGNPTSQSFHAFHTALNVGLFPVIFFFSALYYTDVFSTLVVMVAYYDHLSRLTPESPGPFRGLLTVAVGIAALFMRQTNVFWIVVYFGGLEVVHAVRSLKPAPVGQVPHFSTLLEEVAFYVRRYSLGDVHDPPLSVAWPDDWALCLLSIAIAAVCNPVGVLKQVWPHITVLGLFAGFVIWNGGVVLGDKSNHIATIHLAQMLYIWPFFAFFSAPLLIPTVLGLLSAPMQTMYRLINNNSAPNDTTPSPKQAKQKNKATNSPQSLALRATTLFLTNKIYYIPYLLGTVLLSLAVVKYNTIVHPFTLADNRHYMFYVFRYTILRSVQRRYWLVAAYTACHWLVWKRLAGNPPSSQSTVTADSLKFINTPFPSREMQALSRAHTPAPKKNNVIKEDAKSTAYASPSTSTALIWLLTTALSLITAPLVEPRYFILPWVFFRLLVPAWQPEANPFSADEARDSWWKRGYNRAVGVASRVDLTLAVETAWFLVINLGTMYMFLFRPFMWKSADGEVLDEGRVQRFMW